MVRFLFRLHSWDKFSDGNMLLHSPAHVNLMFCLFRLEEMVIEHLCVLLSVDHHIFIPSTFILLYLFLFSSLSTPWKVVYDMEGWEKNQREYMSMCCEEHFLWLGKKREKRKAWWEALSLLFLINLVMHCSASLPSIFYSFACRFDLCGLMLPSLHISQWLREHWERRE